MHHNLHLFFKLLLIKLQEKKLPYFTHFGVRVSTLAIEGTNIFGSEKKVWLKVLMNI